MHALCLLCSVSFNKVMRSEKKRLIRRQVLCNSIDNDTCLMADTGQFMGPDFGLSGSWII
jgi:hypothetical protein